jgi:polar amino acid transport system permease protein
MIGRLILTYPEGARRTGIAFILCLITLGFYSLGISSAWIGYLVPATSGWLTDNPALGRFFAAGMIALILTANWMALRQLTRRQQIIGVWVELFVLLMLFFYSFNLSLPFIAKKIGYMISQGVVTTLYISAISIVLATGIALTGAIAKLSKNGVIYGLATFYTSLFRGLPLLMQIYIIYLGLPQVGYVIGAVPAGILALSLCYGAYMTEIFRSGIQSIDRGQWEASRSMGFGFSLTMRRIILPQALPVIIPPTGNQFISMLKDSSLVSVIGVWELMFLARTLGQKTFQHMEMLISASLIYWMLSICLELIQSRIERHYARSKVR